MKERYWVSIVFLITPIYELSSLFLNLPDYFSWLLWILLWPVFIIGAVVRIFQKKYRATRASIILILCAAYLPFIFGVLKVKSNLFFSVNKKYMERFVEKRDANSINKLNEIGIQNYEIRGGSVFFVMDTDSDWCWGYAKSISESKPESSGWCPISKWEKIENGWYRWSKL
jgi:hypothetical protein